MAVLLYGVEILFYVSLGAMFHTYCFYPIIVFFLSLLRRKKVPMTAENDLPMVSMIIAVYNEEEVIPEKLKNIKEMDYPPERIEILFGSDGSNDNTNALLQQSGIPILKVHAFSERRGKAAVLNDLVTKAKGAILVFSDANTFYDPSTIRHLVKHFSNDAVGGVCGELILGTVYRTVGGIGEISYWHLENLLKKWESDFKTIVGATGGVYAIRKHLFKQLPLHKAVMDDFLTALEVVKQRFRVLYEPKAGAFEKISGSIRGEFIRKSRIGAANFNGLPEIAPVLHPRFGFASFALWSHKLIRWFVPFFFILALLTSMLLAFFNSFFTLVFSLLMVFILLGIVGWIADRYHVKVGILGFPFYFLAMNTALLVGFIRFLRGGQKATWQVVR